MNNWITTTIIAAVAGAGALSAGNAAKNTAALRSAIAAFVSAGDQRDSAAMQNILHENFRLIAFMGDATAPVALDKTGYTAGLNAGKLGGTKRELTIESVDLMGNNGSCRLRLRSKEMQFETFMQWVFDGHEWRLLNDLTHAVVLKP